MASIGPVPLLLVLILAAGSAFFLARLYRDVFERGPAGAGLGDAFPTIGIALTALFLTVQLSLPLSIGLLAALTVVRFRVPVKEPEEIAFVVALVSVSAMLATLRLPLTGVLLLSAMAAGFATKVLRARPVPRGCLLVLSLPSGHVDQAVLGATTDDVRLQSISVNGPEAVLSYRFPAASEARARAVAHEVSRRLPEARTSVVLERDDSPRE
jgi:hypothetical protein